MNSEYNYLAGLLKSGEIAKLEEAAEIIDDFPDGCDDFIGNRWIINAIDQGCLQTIKWMLGKGVDLAFCGDDGYTPLLSAIDRGSDDRYAVISQLIEHGAPLNRRGINDWTALHLAAAREDIPALKLLIEAGADPQVRTRIDDYRNPLEEARALGWQASVAYLETIMDQDEPS